MINSVNYPITRDYRMEYHVESNPIGSREISSTKLLYEQSIRDGLESLKRRHLGKAGSDSSTTPKRNNRPIIIESSSSSESEEDSNSSIGSHNFTLSKLPNTHELPPLSKDYPSTPTPASRKHPSPFRPDDQNFPHSIGMVASLPRLTNYSKAGEGSLLAVSIELRKKTSLYASSISLPKHALGKRSSSAPSGSQLATRQTSGQNRISTFKKWESVSDVNSEIRNDASLPSSDSKKRKLQESDTLPQQISKVPGNIVPSFYPCYDGKFHSSEINNSLYQAINNQSLKIKVKSGDTSSLGHIYIFTTPDCPKYVKIGMTKQAVDLRISQQQNRCKLVYKRVYGLQDGPFAYYDKVEKLVHLELRNYRRGFKCSNCKTGLEQMPQEHTEWFEISEEKALAVVQRWRSWITVNKPYNARAQLTYYWAWRHLGLAGQLTDVDWDTWLSPPTLLDRLRCIQYYTQRSGHWVWEKTAWIRGMDWIYWLLFSMGVIRISRGADAALVMTIVVLLIWQSFSP